MIEFTESQLNTPVSIGYIRDNGYCAKGTRAYWGSLGLDFKKLIQGNLTVRDLVPYQNDVFVKRLIEELLGVKNGW